MTDSENTTTDAQKQRLPTSVASYREAVESARSGRDLLDALIEPHDAARLVPQLPTGDLHHYLHRIGIHDADGVLALASGEQVRGILDAEVWTGDDLSVERIDPWLGALMTAGPEVLGEHLLALDDSLLNWIVRRSVKVIVVEDPDSFDPPDVEHVVTPDNGLCICFPESAPRDLPVKIFLDWLMRENSAFCMNLLVFSSAALDGNLQEDAYRWRSGRMADRGYVDYYEALPIYTAPRPGQVDAARLPTADDPPAPSRWLRPLGPKDGRFDAAFRALAPQDAEQVQTSLGYAANMALSADRVELWDEDGQLAVLNRLRAGISLGLHLLAGADADPEKDAEVLTQNTVSFVFRTGYGALLDTVRLLRRVTRDGLLASEAGKTLAVDLSPLKPWAEPLTGRHPMAPDDTTPSTAEALAECRLRAEQLAALGRVAGTSRPPEVGLGTWLFTSLTRDLLGIDGAEPLDRAQVSQAHQAFFVDGDFRPEVMEAAPLWWARIGGTRADLLEMLLDEARQQLASVATGSLDARFFDLWWVKR